jgi:hypothetical protein
MRGSIRNPSAKCRHQRLSALLDDLPVGYPEQLRVGDRYAERAVGLPQDDDDLMGGTASEVRRAAPNGRSRHPAHAFAETPIRSSQFNASATDTLISTAGIGWADDRASWTVWRRAASVGVCSHAGGRRDIRNVDAELRDIPGRFVVRKNLLYSSLKAAKSARFASTPTSTTSSRAPPAARRMCSLDHAAVPRSDRCMFHALSLDPSGVTAQDSA